VQHLRSLGYPEDICQAILGHARYTGVPRETPMAKTLFAVDELCGLVTATALVRPSRSVNDVDVRSVTRKLKDKAFARGVDRADILDGAATLGVPLEEHIGVVIGALQRIAPELGLAGSTTS
jgi:predicted hydrolase (HD superfamily)